MIRLPPEDWRRVRGLFEQAMALPAAQRQEFLAAACPDESFQQHVRLLLDAHAHAGGFLETPPDAFVDGDQDVHDLSGSPLGPYELEARIGAGGMGEVYRARDSRLDRVVAIKVLPPSAADDATSRKRFEREARAVAALNHPHICTLHDVGTASGPSDAVQYLVMEFVDGETLADVLARAPVPVDTAIRYATEIASALRAAHRAGIVHRDLKPGNIMVTPSGTKLLDFGLATARGPASVAHGTSPATTDRVTSSSTLFGTVSYMAPEQLRGECADARSDIFALGCVLYEMVTGRKVIDDRPHGVTDGVANDALDHRTLARVGLDEIVTTCLASNPADRWQDADTVLHELQRVEAGPTKGHRRRYSLAAAVVAVALAAGLWVFLPRARSPETATPVAQLAVLPLRTVGDVAGDERLGVAIADAIITRLTTVRRIRLRPTTAVLNYTNASPDPADAATALAVDYVLTGTLQRTASTYRVTLQLVRGSEGAVTWGRSYDVVREGLRDLTDNVAEQVAGALRLEIASDARERLRTRYTSRPDAYDQYLKGRATLLNYTEPGLKEAIAAFERALAIDSGYAPARAGLALATAWWSIRYVNETGPDALRWGERADKEARIALAADPSLAEARLAMAGAAGTLYGGFRWPVVIDEARQALEIDPTQELAHVVLMRAYFHLGLFDRMRAEAEAVRQLNPLGNVEVARLEVAASLFSGAYARARDQAVALLARSEAPVIRNYLGLAQFYSGDVDGARRTLSGIRRGNVPDVRSQAALASVEAAAGDRAAARSRARDIERGPYMDHHVAYSLAAVWAQLGDAAEAVTWLQRAADTGFPCFPSVQRDPLLDGIRQHPRFRMFVDTLRQQFERDAARYATSR
jgi:eukaryotic-like serine/threonine-protein kinase